MYRDEDHPPPTEQDAGGMVTKQDNDRRQKLGHDFVSVFRHYEPREPKPAQYNQSL
jgi:hypothetical protein